MRIDVITIFPGIFESPLRESLLGRAIEAGLVDVRVHDLRDSTTDKHRQVDDESYGGGPGMVLKPEPALAKWALEDPWEDRDDVDPHHRRLARPSTGATRREEFTRVP